jgi:hypothetical protein
MNNAFNLQCRGFTFHKCKIDLDGFITSISINSSGMSFGSLKTYGLEALEYEKLYNLIFSENKPLRGKFWFSHKEFK